MKFRIPFTFSSVEVLKRKAKRFSFFHQRKSKLEEHLKNSDVSLSASEYIGICLRTFISAFVLLLIISMPVFYLLKINFFYIYSFLLSLIFSLFIFFRQFNYPKIYSLRKTRDIEKNLIPSLQDMLVQLESGVPIFQIIVNIAGSDYGFVSYEFKKAVAEINSGTSQAEALENLIKRSNSIYFKRVLWQLSMGLRSGSDMSIVVRSSTDSLNKEQTIQIQNYGGRLNPLIMFYMLIAVILPSLGLTFLTIISSMLNLSSTLVKLLFIGIFVFVVLLQIVFIGMIRTRRPSLL